MYSAPVVERHGQIKQPAVVAGKIEVKKAGQIALFKHHIVAKQVRMNRAARQGGIGRAGGDMVLKRQFADDQIALRIR